MSGLGIGLDAYKLAFGISPIFLTGGLAQNIPGSVLPIVVLTEVLNLPLGLIGGTETASLDGMFAQYVPMAGATLIDNAVAEYPFANQAVAANALIQQPLVISMRMVCPAKGTLGAWAKLATMLLLRNALAEHNRRGGLYTVATPSNFYTNCIMLRMADVTGGETKQSQAVWQIDFRQPLLTSEAAQAAQSSLMSKLSNGTQIDGQPAWSGADSNIGQPSALAPVSPASQAAGSSVITPPTPSNFGSGP